MELLLARAEAQVCAEAWIGLGVVVIARRAGKRAKARAVAGPMPKRGTAGAWVRGGSAHGRVRREGEERGLEKG